METQQIKRDEKEMNRRQVARCCRCNTEYKFQEDGDFPPVPLDVIIYGDILVYCPKCDRHTALEYGEETWIETEEEYYEWKLKKVKEVNK